jgi:GTP-binding protein
MPDMAADFVRSVARADDFPRDGLREIALVGRSNVGKSSLINAVTRTRIARTGAAPGTTRLANIYRVTRGRVEPFYLVDLPGYGYARGGRAAGHAFDALTRAYFDRAATPAVRASPGHGEPRRGIGVSALLLVDVRHPGLERDLEAWTWLQTVVKDRGLVATKVDKLARGERIRALGVIESVFGDTVVPISAATGEGLDKLWKLIDRLANSPNLKRRSSPPGPPPRHKKNP